MPNFLCLTITFLDARFHGRRDGGEPEWPPSPLRLFQAIVAAAAAPTGSIGSLDASLRWFENLSPPQIIAPVGRMGEPYRLSVPNNAMDLVVKAWARGNYDGSGDSNPATHRTMKTVRPTHLVGGDQIRFLWPLLEPMTEEVRRHAEAIRTAVRGIVALGWGIDLVVGHGDFISNEAPESMFGSEVEHWEACINESGVSLRVPRPGTLDGLIRRHTAFQNRVTDDGFVPVPPLTAFANVSYRRATDLLARHFAAFALRATDDPAKWRALSQANAIFVAAMLRHVAWEAAKADMGGWRDKKWAEEFVAGHGARNSRKSFPRFSYLPLPTIGPTHADGMIRRVLIAETCGGDGRSAHWAGMRLGGQLLQEEGTNQKVAMLQPISQPDYVTTRYTGQSATWESITPVILPGYDDGKPAKRERILRQCLEDAGLDISAVASMDSQRGSFDRASISMLGYRRPKYLANLPACHVRLKFRQPVRGPLVIGAGRHCGLGIFATT